MPRRPPDARARFAFIEGIRGVGAVAIALYHLFRYGPLPEAADSVLPTFIRSIFDHGWMAVQWFFVIAGFGIAQATLDHQITGRAFWIFLRRRTLRLGVVYWFTLALVTLLTIFAIFVLNDRTLNERMPTWDQVLAHFLFLHDILGYDNLTTGIWFLAIDVQFGVVFIALLAAAQRSARWLGGTADHPGTLAILFWFAPLALWSLFDSAITSSTDMWFHHFFCLHVFGALVAWTLDRRLATPVVLAYGLAFAVQAWRHESLELTTATVAASTLLVVGWLGKLPTWLGAPFLQYLGRISYSLFLIHFPIGWLVTTLGFRLTGDQPFAALAWLVAAFVASVGAAHLLYTWVERPALSWARGVQA